MFVLSPNRHFLRCPATELLVPSADQSPMCSQLRFITRFFARPQPLYGLGAVALSHLPLSVLRHVGRRAAMVLWPWAQLVGLHEPGPEAFPSVIDRISPIEVYYVYAPVQGAVAGSNRTPLTHAEYRSFRRHFLLSPSTDTTRLRNTEIIGLRSRIGPLKEEATADSNKHD